MLELSDTTDFCSFTNICIREYKTKCVAMIPGSKLDLIRENTKVTNISRTTFSTSVYFSSAEIICIGT